MKAIVQDRFGGAGSLQLREVEKPSPKENEVQIQVAYAGVNPVDWKIREGYLKDRLPHKFPIIPGWDVSGIVSQIGAKVKNLTVGTSVYSYIRKPEVHEGAFCEYVCFNAADVVKMPKNLTFAQAAAVPLAALTAWQSLFEKGQLQANDSIFIQGGAGVVGSFAIQLAKYVKAYPIITSAKTANHPYLKSMGADVVIDYTKSPIGDEMKKMYPQGVDFVFDTVGGSCYTESLPLLKEGGQIVTLLTPPEYAKIPAHVRALYVFVHPSGLQLQLIGQLLQEKVLLPPPIYEYPLEEADFVLEQMREGHPVGKLVLKVASL